MLTLLPADPDYPLPVHGQVGCQLIEFLLRVSRALSAHRLGVDDQDQIPVCLWFEPWKRKEHVLSLGPRFPEAVEVGVNKPHDVFLIAEVDIMLRLMLSICHPRILRIRRKAKSALNLNIRIRNKIPKFTDKLLLYVESVVTGAF